MASKKQVWFKKYRHSYIAVSPMGALVYVPYVAYLLFSLIVPWRDMHPKVLGLLVAIPNWAVATWLTTILAKAKS